MFSRSEFVCYPGLRRVTPGKHTNSGLYRFMFAGSLNHKPGRFFQRILSGYRVHNFCVSLTTNQRNPWNPAGNHPEPGIHRNSGTSIRLETALRAKSNPNPTFGSQVSDLFGLSPTVRRLQAVKVSSILQGGRSTPTPVSFDTTPSGKVVPHGQSWPLPPSIPH